MWNFASIHWFPMFSYFPRLSFWQEQRVDENEYGTFVGRYRQGKTDVCGNICSLKLCTPIFSSYCKEKAV